MTEALVQSIAIGVIAALLAFELAVAITSWIEARAGVRRAHHATILVTQPFAIRRHFKARRTQINALRHCYPLLRSPGYGHDVRRAIRSLQPTRFTALVMDCSACRGSRMRGLPRCPDCGRPLLAPVHGAQA